jgi:outer membrane lipoprotein-sorting protein
MFMFQTSLRCVTAFLLVLFGTLCFMAPISAYALDGAEILRQADKNLNPDSFESYRKLINIEPDGTKKEFVLYTVKKGPDKMVSMFLSPASEKGRSTLRLDENMWFFIPNVGKPIRITSLQSVVGGVFNNSDILRLDYSSEYNVEKMEEEDGLYLLHLKAKTNGIAYDKLKMWVDKKAIVPTTIECYAASDMLIKTIRYKQPTDFGNGVVRPAVIETDSPLYKGYKSAMIYAKINPKELADEVFTINYLSRVDELR